MLMIHEERKWDKIPLAPDLRCGESFGDNILYEQRCCCVSSAVAEQRYRRSDWCVTPQVLPGSCGGLGGAALCCSHGSRPVPREDCTPLSAVPRWLTGAYWTQIEVGCWTERPGQSGGFPGVLRSCDTTACGLRAWLLQCVVVCQVAKSHRSAHQNAGTSGDQRGLPGVPDDGT